jgi:sensor domain CHASE-containing protein
VSPPSAPDAPPARRNAIGRPQLVGLAVGLVSLLLAGVVVLLEDRHEIDSARTLALAQATDRANVIQVALDRALSASYALGAMVRQGGGRIDNFDTFAAQLKPYYPGVVSLQLAPGGVVRQIYPLAGNEKAIGHDLLADPQRNREAFLARDTRQLTLAGPFKLVQGGIGAVGRLPVYLPGKDADALEFWGFAIALIGFPDLLREVGLPRLQERGYDYALWKAHPDTGFPR